jgi:hypothetical protein
MKEQVVMARPSEKRSPLAEPDARLAWRIILIVGIAAAIVGITDVGLLFFPARWASLEWEFGTISATIEGLPLCTLGLGLIAAAMVAQGYALGRRLLGPLLLVVGLFVVALLVIFALDVPVALRSSEPALRAVLRKQILKTALMGVSYVFAYSVLGVWTWRRSNLKGA